MNIISPTSFTGITAIAYKNNGPHEPISITNLNYPDETTLLITETERGKSTILSLQKEQPKVKGNNVEYDLVCITGITDKISFVRTKGQPNLIVNAWDKIKSLLDRVALESLEREDAAKEDDDIEDTINTPYAPDPFF